MHPKIRKKKRFQSVKASNNMHSVHVVLGWAVWKEEKSDILKMNFFQSISILQKVCQLVGLSPFSLEKHEFELNSVRKVIVLITILAQLTQFICSVVFNGLIVQLDFAKSVRLVDCTQLFLIQLTALAIFIESYTKRFIQIDFLQKISTIDFVLEYKIGIKMNYIKERRRTSQRLIRWILIDFSVLISIAVLSYHLYDYVHRWWTIFWISFFICSMRYFQITSYVYLIRRRYEQINVFVDELLFSEQRGTPSNLDLAIITEYLQKDETRRTWNKYMSRGAYEKLIDLRRVYRLMSSASENINQMFQWSIPFNISNDFFHILIESYWILRIIIEQTKSPVYVVAPILLAIMNLNHILSFSYHCHRASEEVIIIYFRFSWNFVE